MTKIIAMLLLASATTAQASGCFDRQLEPTERLAPCEQAARQGDAEAQYQLGQILKSGTGLPADPEQAAQWFGKAAAAGLPEAQYALGMMYELGTGLPKDEQQAAAWYLKAAEQGNSDAQWLLGSMYEFGRGVELDLLEAHMWYSLSAASGNPYGKNRKAAVSMMLSPQQLEQSKARMNEWSDKNWWAAPATTE